MEEIPVDRFQVPSAVQAEMQPLVSGMFFIGYNLL